MSSVTSGAVLVALVACLGACGAIEDGRSVGVRTDTVGDTITITTIGPRMPGEIRQIPMEDVRVLYRDDRLGWPGAIVDLDSGRIAIADRTRVHVVALNGQSSTVVGRAGKGPGEFTSIEGLAAWPGDSLVVWNAGLRRLTWISVDGGSGRSITIGAPVGLLGGAPIDLFIDDEVAELAWYTGYVDPGGPPPAYAVVRHYYATSAQQEVARVNGMAMIGTSSGVFVPRALYGPRPLYAVAPHGQVAITDGVEYCVTVFRRDDAQVRKICRDIVAPLVGRSVLDPFDDRVAQVVAKPEELRFLRSRLEVQEWSERKNAIADIQYAENGYLWVRRVGEDEQYDPMLLGQFPELRPAYYEWDVFDGDGAPIMAVRLPSRFDPGLIAANQMAGVLLLNTGEQAIGVIPLEQYLPLRKE